MIILQVCPEHLVLGEPKKNNSAGLLAAIMLNSATRFIIRSDDKEINQKEWEKQSEVPYKKYNCKFTNSETTRYV